MAIIEWPEELSRCVQAMRMRPKAPMRVSTSPYDQSVQTVGQPGGKWSATLTFNDRAPDKAPELQALFADLQSGANRLRLYPLERPIPRGTLRGEPKVDGANQAGRSVNIKDCLPGADLRPGDYIFLNNQLLMVTARSVAGPTGRMAISINFPMLTSPANNAPLQWDRPAPLWIIDPENQPGWERGPWWTSFDTLSLIQVRA